MSRPSSPVPAARASLPILLLSAAGFPVLTTEFVIVGLPAGVSQAGLPVTLFALTVAVALAIAAAVFAMAAGPGEGLTQGSTLDVAGGEAA